MEYLINRTRVTCFDADIAQQRIDVVVNAANPQLAGGGGVDGAIHRAGGPALDAECRQLVVSHGPLATGQAVITGGGKLLARKVIHTVGPVWQGGSAGEAELLASCYAASLRLAAENWLRSIAVPLISTGAYGYPLREASQVALRAVRDYVLARTSFTEVRFVVLTYGVLNLFVKIADQILGPVQTRGRS